MKSEWQARNEDAGREPACSGDAPNVAALGSTPRRPATSSSVDPKCFRRHNRLLIDWTGFDSLRVHHLMPSQLDGHEQRVFTPLVAGSNPAEGPTIRVQCMLGAPSVRGGVAEVQFLPLGPLFTRTFGWLPTLFCQERCPDSISGARSTLNVSRVDRPVGSRGSL